VTEYMEKLRKRMMEVSNGEWKILDEKVTDSRREVRVEYVPKVLAAPVKVRAHYVYTGNWVEWDKKYYCDVQIGGTKVQLWAYSLEMLFEKLRQLFEVVEHAEVIR